MRQYTAILCHLLFFIALTSCSKTTATQNGPNYTEIVGNTYTVPLSGNAYLTSGQDGQSARIDRTDGLTRWADADAVVSIYARVNQTGKLAIGLNAKQTSENDESRIKVTINGKSKEITIADTQRRIVAVGEFDVQVGYVQIDLQGLSKTGQYFADISEAVIGGEATDQGVVYSDNPEYYYWARRGPSCHLAYTIPTTEDIAYYYSELTVPEGEDPIGSYFMANGFGEGYFGIQVNSSTERRVLFSVWSPFETDDPSTIPDDQKITLNKAGADVHIGEFGNEGSGGQSYYRFNWKAGDTYRFLLKGVPDGNGKTDYTAWFFAPEANSWQLIASFKRPETDTYLKRFHSFLENFDPTRGYLGRKASYENQWVHTATGEWLKVQQATFTVDATYGAGQRVDAIGGVTDTGFFLQNGGYFDDHIAPGTAFSFEHSRPAPQIDFDQLP